jgi:Flp pilus assembly protein TadD
MIGTKTAYVVLALLAFSLQATAQTNRRAKQEPTQQQQAIADSNMQLAKNALEKIEAQPHITRRQLNATVDPEVMRGYKALQANQFSEAREAYSQVLARNATQRDALLGIAYAHHSLGDTAQAMSTLRRLLELYPRDSDAASALYLVGGGDPQAEESRFKQLLERSERPSALHYALGVLYFEQNRYGEAERSFARAASLEPEQPDYAYNWALSLDRLGRVREAARQYVTALNLANQASAVFSRDLARSRVRVLTAAAK